MKCRTCEADLSDDDEFCCKCGTTVSECTMVVLCGGRRKDGTPCGAELKEGYNFCKRCGKKVDILLSQNKQIKCEGKKEDGSVCGSFLEEDAVFCMKCGTHRITAPVSKEKETDGSSPDNLLSTVTIDLTSGAAQVFGSSAKLDGENIQEFNIESTPEPLFSSISTAVPSGNVLLPSMNISQDRDADKEENAGQYHFSSAQISSVAGVFEMGSQLDGENIGQTPTSSSSYSVVIHENDLDNDPEEEKVNLSSNAEPVCRTSAELECQLSNVNLSEEEFDDIEDSSEDNFDDENENCEGDDKCSNNSNPAHFGTEFAEDKTTELKLSQEHRKKRSKRKKKPAKYKLKMEKKKKIDMGKKMPSAELLEQKQKQQQDIDMESERNRNVKCSTEGQESNLHQVVDDTSAVAVYSTISPMDLTNQMESTLQIDQSSVPVQESRIEQDPKMNKVTLNVRESYAKVVTGTSTSQHDEKDIGKTKKMEDVKSMEPTVSNDSTGSQYIEDNSSNKGQASSGTEDTKSEETKNEKYSENKAEKSNEGSEAVKLSKDKKNQRTSENSKPDPSQNASSKNTAPGGKNDGKDTKTRKNADVIRVYFHSLVSAEFGLSPTDVLIVRLDENELGGWQSDKNRPELVRKHGADYTEYKLVLDVPKWLLFKSKKIQYKYVVAVDRAHKDKECKYVWEHYSSHGNLDRRLNLPDNKKNIEEWHQYDGIVFPQGEEGIWNYVKNIFKGNVKEKAKRDLAQCMEYFLPKFFQDLSKGQLPELSIGEALTQLEELLYSLRKVYFVDFDCYKTPAEYDRKISETIILPMLNSFEKVSLCNWEENKAESERRMLLAISVVSVLYLFKLELNTADEELLARGLLVRPNHETKICHDLACIDKYFPKERKKQLNDYLISFINRMAKKAESPMIFLCMPLHHFLSGALKPFDRIPEDFYHDAKVPKWWGLEFLPNAAECFKKGQHYKGTMNLDQLISNLHPLFEMDYLLPRTLMAMLKLEMVAEAIKTDKIPCEVCTATLTYYVRTTRSTAFSLYPSNEEKIVGGAIFVLRDVCKASVQNPDERHSLIQAKMFCKIAGSLLNETLGSRVHFLVAGAVQIMLNAVSSYDVIHKRQNSEASDTQKQTGHLTFLKELSVGVRKWHAHCLQNWKSYLEPNLRFWDSIFATSDLQSETVKEDWNSDVEKDLNQILRGQMLQDTYGTKLLIELYCTKVETFHPCVQNCLSQLAFKAIETGYSAQMRELRSHERERFGKLLSSLYEREWVTAMKVKDMEEDRIILQHILTWTPFSHYLNMFYGDEKKVDLLSPLCVQELTQAISVIDQRVHALENGTVTLRDLSLIKDAEDKFQELTRIMLEKTEGKKGKIVNVSKAVKIRQKEVETYLTQKTYVATLLQLCQHIRSVQTSELDKIIRQLNEKKDLCIRDICQPADVDTTELDKFYPQITAHKLSAEVISMLEPMHASYRSNIFLNLWQNIGRRCQSATLNEVCEQVWKPSISKMREITQKLVNGDILFAEMEKYVGQIYGDDHEKMVEEMKLINVSDVKARDRVKQLKQFRQLEACVEGAKTILKVAQAYELRGDFEVIKTIALQQNAADKMMKEFDESLLNICAFLEDLTAEKTNCLIHFIKCKLLVLWLRDSMKGGLKELKVFVDLASISAGEGDMEIAKVNCLHAATTGYASLIFDLAEDSDYKALLERCQILWKELKADQNLPKKLLDTNRHLEWLKTVKQAHGSVEVTSLSQAEAINSKGIFCVGALDTEKNMGLDLQNTLHLTVPDHDSEFKSHRKYTFEQLQDLQSRLMLVAGKAEQGKDDVDRFMLVFDSVTRLAKDFIKLNAAGCVLFKHWQTNFLCDPKRPVCAFIEFGQGTKPLKGRRTKNDDVTAVIPKIARFMENCLDKWMAHINQKRSEYSELNYFTTDQLVILQQELVKIAPGQSPDIRIYPLLSAVKENCTYEDLVDAMRKASKDVEVVQMEVDEELKEREEDEEIASDVVIEKEKQTFIEEMIEAGYSEKLAEAALLYVKPDEITEGIIWCSEHLDDEDMYSEEDKEMGDGDQPAKEVIPYEGWKKSDQSVMSITASILNRLEVAKGELDVDPLIKDLERLWEEFLTSVSSSVTDYLSVEHLGLIVRRLAEKDSRQINRLFPSSFVPGTPNLILCPKADILSTVLSIYMMDHNQPLPQADEVLVCTPLTTLDQLDVFWRRTVADTTGRIHCMVNSDLLDFEVSDHGERRLEQYMQQRKHLDLQYRLVVVCSTENEYKSRIITALDKFRRPPLPIPDIRHIADYVKKKLQVNEGNSAAAVDFDKSSVRVVKSWRAGVGKSLFVKRSNEQLTQQNNSHKITDLVNIPLQDKEINVSQVTQILLTHILQPGATTPRIFHLDIAHEVQEGVDHLLFSLLILGSLTDKSGYVWRRMPRDLYLVETMPIVESVQARKGGNASYVHHVFDFLPFLTCRSPQESVDILTNKPMPRDFKQEDPQFDPKEFIGQTFQRPYQYLSRFEQGKGINDVDPTVPSGTPADCLKVLLRHCGVPDPSWAELHHFVWFLNTQLRDFEKSSFCSAAVAEDLPGFSKFVLRFLIQMSRDFSTRSLQMSEESPTTRMEVDRKMLEEEANSEAGEEGLSQYQMRRTWESSPHPYLFFNPDGHTITFLGFNIERQTGNLIDQQTRKVLETAIMPQYLYDSLVRNRVPIQENFDSLPRETKIERLCLVMGNEMPHDPDDTYELTTDNVKKILAIYMRFRCDIPVIIMGETGCGKTRLVKFMCALQSPPGTDVKNMILMKVHGGTTNVDIKRKVEEAKKIAQQNAVQYGPHVYTVLFFDEANTTEAIGLIKEIMCDRSMEGNHLDKCQNLKFVAACNPYKKHSEALIKRLEQAGLGYHVDADKTTDRLGRVPMRRLVYRVQPLPQSLLPLVWDFGQLNTQIEDLYIRQMVKRYIRNGKLPAIQGLIEVISGVLTASQDFMRKQQDECSFVSLRDVERVLNVMSWFYTQCDEERTLFDRMDQIIQPYDEDGEDMEEEEEDQEEEQLENETHNDKLDDVTRSLVLALGVCYHACLKNREDYRKHVAPYFRAPCHLPLGHQQIEENISVCQDVFLENVPLEKNIAKNVALKENVFMMVTSIELRIPLFLVGKPGSSKSLAKTIVADAMQGNAAHKDLFKEFKQVQMVSFQCSPLSTPDGIVGTFRQCAQFQKDKDLDRFVSVVVLDEVGLAEDSPRMPLKTLHPLLEDGCQGDEEPLPHKKVAFIGISNWALDPAKMNRGILVQREVPDLEELKNTAEGICVTKNHVYKHVKPFIEPLATSYLALFGKASTKLREFFGLRDFYSLMKMIYSLVERTNKPPTWYQLLHCIKRNFGGLDTINPIATFSEKLTMMDTNVEHREGDPDCTTKGLIKACLQNASNAQSESRYLLLLTENYGALSIMQQLIPTSNIITIFGSSFPSDQEYTQVCRNINRIKVCMETGNTVVLLNLENLYESLYDALNQYYVYFGGERYVDLGLGTHRVKCRVHKNFRLIVVAEKDVVYKKFPIPLINRLEKHYLTANTVLTREHSELAKDLEKWAEDFSTETTSMYIQRNEKLKATRSVGEVFMGYHADTCSSIILVVWQRQEEECSTVSDQKTLVEAKKLLLWCATPDSVVRLERCNLPEQEKNTLTNVYMKEQCHENLAQYLHFKLFTEKTQELFAQVTTHSKLLSTADKSDIYQAVGIPPERIALETLQSFDTEQQFSRKLRYFLESTPDEELLLVVQCDSGDTNASLVACARYCILDEHQHMKDRRTAACHIVFIIQLPRIAGGCFTGFQCGLWHSVHIDDLRSQDEDMPSIIEMHGKSVGTLMEIAVGTMPDDTTEMEVEEMFRANRIGESTVAMETEMNDTEMPSKIQNEKMDWEGEERDEPSIHADDQVHELQDIIHERVDRKLNIRSLILSCVQPALAMIKDKEETTDRSTRRIEIMLYLLHQNTIDGLPTFLQGLSRHIAALLKEKEKNAFRADNWLSSEAAKPENINKAGTFRRACMQYLESKISPILAGIIAHIDTNHNLDIIHSHITSGNWKANLWLQILNTPGVIQLQYSDLQSPTRQQELNEIVVKTTGCEGQMFTGMIPFSWLIYEQIDNIWRTAQQSQEENEEHLKMEKIVNLVKETKLGQRLEMMDIVSSEDIGFLYAEDFTYIVYHAQSPEEHELVHKAIMQTSATLLEGTSPNILARLVSIHESHSKIVQHLRYFRSINQVWPECAAAIKRMQKETPGHFLLVSDQFTLAILGLCLLIEQLKPLDKEYLNNAASRLEWLQKICNYRPVIERGLDLNSTATGTRVDQEVLQAKQTWTRITVVKLFIEHVVTSEKEADKDGPKRIMPLWVLLGDSADLKQVRSVENVEKFLKMCNTTAIKDLLGKEHTCSHCEDKIEGTPVVLPCKDAICYRCFLEIDALGTKKCPKCSRTIPDKFNPKATGKDSKAVQKFKEYQSKCNSFFMDVVSQLCFVDNTAPSDEVVDKLLGYITMTTAPGRQGKMETRHLTKELTIFNDCVDPNPVFRSFLLQLLLRTSEKRVHHILEKYFSKAEAVIGEDNIDMETHMVKLCQLVIQCLEDSFYLECLKEVDISIATNHLTDAVHDLTTSTSMLDRLYGIAKARFGLAVTAKHIQETVLNKGQMMVAPELRRLIDRAATLCEDNCKWLKIFFIKYLCRCYGVDSYQAACKKNDLRYLRWIKYQADEEKVREVSDRYIVCGPNYITIREAVTKVVLGEGTEQLDKAVKDTKVPENMMEILLCLALHREITMSNLHERDKSKVTPKATELLHKFCLESKFLKNKDIADKILQNTYGARSLFLNVMPVFDLKHQGVVCLLIHFDLVLRNLPGNNTLVQPLVRLATQPHIMINAFLPTMPQDDVEELKQVILANREGGNPVFYRCPNGHPYIIGDCGRPATVGKCPKCGSEIGGQSHVARPGNAPDPGVDRTETGHILGRAENRTQLGPERTLTPAYCGIMRLLTHLTMMLGANINSLAVSQFIKPNIIENTVIQFLLQHIEHDLGDLHRALGKSLDDVFIILHRILFCMMERHNENETLHDELCGLMTKKGRHEWEKKFSEKFVVPTLQNMETILKECNQQLAQDKRLGSDPLLCLLYEIAQPQENIPLEMLQEIPSMWRFRSRITMDHLRHEFEVLIMAQNKDKGQYKVLQLFLQEEHHLRAIRFLPNILKLQRILFQKYQRKLDRAEASTITVQMLRDQSDGDELQRLLDEYAEVWDLVREHLVFVPKEYRMHRIDDNTPVSQLLPTASDAGHCAYSVLEFLFRTQNEFMDNYYTQVKRSVKEIPHVKVRDITPAHLISYHPEQDILPLVLANCNYSFEVGKGTTIEYNFSNLERQIMDRFLFGKSKIEMEIELMVYRAEYTNATVFKKLQEKIPQEPLSIGTKHKIIEEFRSLPDLCQALDNLDIAISFLKSIGGDLDKNLDTFMVETLKMEQSLYSPKAKQICQYRHAQSLWLLLSSEKNKQLALHNHMVFDGLPEEFHQQLSVEHIEVMAFLQPLSLERLELLLELMFECIILVIAVPQKTDDEDYVDIKEKKFKDYLLALMMEKEVELPFQLDAFPDDVLCKFCVATWTLTYQTLQEKTRQRY